MLKAKPWNNEPVNWISRKYDGHRVFIEKDECGRVKVFTERKNITAQVAENRWFPILIVRVPNNTKMEAELVCDGHATDVSHKLAGGMPLDLVVFAIPIWGGHNIESKGLDFVHDLCTKWGLRFTEYAPYREQDAEMLLTQCRMDKWEGVVLKMSNYWRWYKLKVENTCECFITGFVDGKGKYIGLVGSLRVSLYGSGNRVHEVATVGGFTDEIRIGIDETSDLYRVCEVRFQNVGSNGRLRHPRFVRWRDDRKAEHCYIGQIDTSRCKTPIT